MIALQTHLKKEVCLIYQQKLVLEYILWMVYSAVLRKHSDLCNYFLGEEEIKFYPQRGFGCELLLLLSRQQLGLRGYSSQFDTRLHKLFACGGRAEILDSLPSFVTLRVIDGVRLQSLHGKCISLSTIGNYVPFTLLGSTSTTPTTITPTTTIASTVTTAPVTAFVTAESLHFWFGSKPFEYPESDFTWEPGTVMEFHSVEEQGERINISKFYHHYDGQLVAIKRYDYPDVIEYKLSYAGREFVVAMLGNYVPFTLLGSPSSMTSTTTSSMASSTSSTTSSTTTSTTSTTTSVTSSSVPSSGLSTSPGLATTATAAKSSTPTVQSFFDVFWLDKLNLWHLIFAAEKKAGREIPAKVDLIRASAEDQRCFEVYETLRKGEYVSYSDDKFRVEITVLDPQRPWLGTKVLAGTRELIDLIGSCVDKKVLETQFNCIPHPLFFSEVSDRCKFYCDGLNKFNNINTFIRQLKYCEKEVADKIPVPPEHILKDLSSWEKEDGRMDTILSSLQPLAETYNAAMHHFGRPINFSVELNTTTVELLSSPGYQAISALSISPVTSYTDNRVDDCVDNSVNNSVDCCIDKLDCSLVLNLSGDVDALTSSQ